MPEKDIFYFYSDHLSHGFYFWREFNERCLDSSSCITTVNGQISQHIEYIAFNSLFYFFWSRCISWTRSGEVLFKEHASSFKTPYFYNGKELDREIRSIRENKNEQIKKLSKQI